MRCCSWLRDGVLYSHDVIYYYLLLCRHTHTYTCTYILKYYSLSALLEQHLNLNLILKASLIIIQPNLHTSIYTGGTCVCIPVTLAIFYMCRKKGKQIKEINKRRSVS